MYFLYSLALTLLFLFLLPYLIFQAVRHGKYTGSFKQRLGLLPEALRENDRPTIWVHAVSVGEFNAARPLIERLRQEMPGCRIVVSTTTLTGQQLALSHRSDSFDAVFYFPFDWVFAVRRALDHIRPAAVIILETELWPNFLRECRRREVITAIVNGRISPRSFAGYKRFRRFVGRMLEDITLLIVQSEADAERARQLGARPESVLVCGNLKYDIGAGGRGPGAGASPRVRDHVSGAGKDSASTDLPGVASTREATETLPTLSPPGPREAGPLIVAGSTAPGEEKTLLDSLRDIRSSAGLENVCLMLAPRHPERFDEVAEVIAQSGFHFIRRSQFADDFPASAFESAEVVLLDTIGELAEVYRFASVVFIGGSLVPRGGHNIIEPAVYAKPIIVGPYMENFRQIVSDFKSADALVQTSNVDGNPAVELTRELIRLLSDAQAARAMGARAQRLLTQNRGATRCSVVAIKRALDTSIYGSIDSERPCD